MTKPRNWHAVNAWQRKAGPMADRRREMSEREIVEEQMANLDELWPPRGPCAFCGGPDARHRVFDAVAERHAIGESIESLMYDYGKSEAQILAAIEHGELYDWEDDE